MPFGDLLDQLEREKAIVDIRRDRIDADDLRGMILEVSPSLVLLGIVSDGIRRDGYSIIARDQVTFLRWGTGVLRARQRIVESRGDHPDRPTLDLSDWHQAIATAREHSPIMTFQRESSDPQTCYLSDDFEVKGDLIVGSQVTTEGERDGYFALNLDDLTRIDFGGSYETGLFAMLGRA